MIAKLIEVQVRAGCAAEYRAAQAIWDRETLRDPDCLGSFTGADPERADVIWVTVLWRSRRAYDRWMATDHDRIAVLAEAGRYYERIKVRILDPAVPDSRLGACLDRKDR